MRTRRWLAALVTGLAAAGAAAEEPFEVVELPGPGRVVTAGIADLDGDGLADVFALSLYGLPPHTRRELRVHFQRPDGSFPSAPDWSGSAMTGAGAYDVADLPDGPGEEILVLLRDRVRVLSFTGRTLTQRDLVIPGDPTMAVAPDERGLDRYRLWRRELGDSRLLVPGLGELIVLTPQGKVAARMDVGHRANYFIPERPGPLVGESEMETYYDFPRIEIGDVDGDGRPDVMAATRHELRVFLQREDGGFPHEPDQRLALGRLDQRDQIRGSGNVRVESGDFDGDGRADLIVTATTGGLLGAKSRTTFHLNRGGTWDLQNEDGGFIREGSWSFLGLLDVDGDGRPELIEGRVPLTVLQLVEVLLTRSVDVDVSYYRAADQGVFAKEPWMRTKLDVGIEFDTFTQKGFLPTFDVDVNGDGLPDRLEAGGGEAVEVFLGGEDQALRRRVARQPMDTRGSIRMGDVDRDGLADFLLFDRTRPDSPLRLVINRGILPGTRKKTHLEAGDD